MTSINPPLVSPLLSSTSLMSPVLSSSVDDLTFEQEYTAFMSKWEGQGFVSIEDLQQAFFKLYKKLQFTAMSDALRMRFEVFHVKVKAAEESYKSAMTSGITTLAILAPGVAFGLGTLGKGLHTRFATRSPVQGGGVKDPSRTEASALTPKFEPDASTPSGSHSRRRSSSEPSGAVPKNSRSAGDNEIQPAPQQDSAKDASKLKEPPPNPDGMPLPETTRKKEKSDEWRTAFQGVAMFMLPSGSSAAGEMAGAEPQAQSEILKAMADLIDDYVKQLVENAGSYQDGIRNFANALTSN